MCLGPTSITSIARAALETTEIFLSSRVTLCSRVISLYASGEESKKIHTVRTPVAVEASPFSVSC